MRKHISFSCILITCMLFIILLIPIAGFGSENTADITETGLDLLTFLHKNHIYGR